MSEHDAGGSKRPVTHEGPLGKFHLVQAAREKKTNSCAEGALSEICTTRALAHGLVAPTLFPIEEEVVGTKFPIDEDRCTRF